MKNRYGESTVELKELMTADPISAEAHAAVMRSKVEARRQVEDAIEAAKQRREELL